MLLKLSGDLLFKYLKRTRYKNHITAMYEHSL